MMRKLLFFAFTVAILFSQAVTQAGLRNKADATNTVQIGSDSIFFRIAINGFADSNLAVGDFFVLWVYTYANSDLSGTRTRNDVSATAVETRSVADTLYVTIPTNGFAAASDNDSSLVVGFAVLDENSQDAVRRHTGSGNLVDGLDTYTGLNTAPTGFNTSMLITAATVLNELGLRSNDDSDQYVTTSTDSFHVRFDVSSGTVPTAANAVRVYQLNASNVELANQLYSNVTITDLGGPYQIKLDNLFSPFNASLDHFVVTIQLESGGTIYTSGTISSGSQTLVSTAVSGFFSTLLDGTPTITSLGVQADTSNDQNLNTNESLDVRFVIGANEEVPTSSTGNVSIYEFNGDVQVGSATTRSNVDFSDLGSNTYGATITGLSSFASNVDSIAVLVDLVNTSTDYKSKSAISGGTHVSTSPSSYFSVLNATVVGPNAPTGLSLRYGAPSDGVIFLSYTAGTNGGESAITGHRIVYSTSAIADTTDGSSILLGSGSQTEYRLSIPSGSSNFVSVFSIDGNGNTAEAEFNSGAALDRNQGLTFTFAGTGGFTASNIASGSSSDNVVSSFTLTPSGTVSSSDQAILTTITFTAADSNNNVSSSEVDNIRVYRDVNTDNALDGGDLLMNSASVGWTDGSFAVTLNQNNSLAASTTYRLLLVLDANSVDGSMKINLSIANSAYSLSDDGGITASETASLTGTVGAQGSEGDGDITLPVSLISNSFHATKVRNGFELTAETAEENSVNYIIYQRSTVNKELSKLEESDWEDTGLKIESSVKYLTNGRKLPKLIDNFDASSVKRLRYRLITEELDGSFKTKYDNDENIITVDSKVLEATSFKLNQNYPNPFNPKTKIEFSIPYETVISIDIYNLIGQKVRTLVNNQQYSARKDHFVEWFGKDDHGKQVSSGVYFYRIVSKDASYFDSKKMILLK